MKLIATIFFLFTISTLFGAVKTTVADGDWFNANNWLPSGVPLMEDTVIINHNITISGQVVDYGAQWMIVNANASLVSDTIFALHGNLKMYGMFDIQNLAVGDGDSTLVYGSVYGVYFSPGNNNNINYGSIYSDSLIAGADFNNYGLIDCLTLVAGGNYFINHSLADVIATGMSTFSNSANTYNQVNANMTLGELVTGEDFINDGNVTCTNWTHGSGIVNGNAGNFCVSQCFINSSTINGNIDICDATPSTMCDFNFGTIAGTVTFCTVGSCVDDATITEISNETNIYPNPAVTEINLKGLTENANFAIVSLTGATLISGVCTESNLKIDVSFFEAGIYFAIVQNAKGKSTYKFIKK